MYGCLLTRQLKSYKFEMRSLRSTYIEEKLARLFHPELFSGEIKVKLNFR